MIKIHLFKQDYQSGINDMMNDIVNEFELPISNENKSRIQSLDKYWVAIDSKKIIGSVGVLKTNNADATLKNMFVKKEYRGKDYRLAQMLLYKVIDWCHSEDIDNIYLGTMNQFKAAHKFYEKHGFQKISTSELPSVFIRNPIDDVFYKRNSIRK